MSPTKPARKTLKKTGKKTLKKKAGLPAKKAPARKPAASANKPAKKAASSKASPKTALKAGQVKAKLPGLPRLKKKKEDPSRGRAMAVAAAALDKKALDLVVLQVTELVSYTDYFVICTGNSRPHVQAVADNVEDALRKAGVRPLGKEGRTHGRWVLMDYGDVVLHVMDPEARAYYGIEKLWLDAPRVSVDAYQGFVGRQDKGAVGCGCG